MITRTITIGTAGHIDHGKSSFVKALTGTDPDRFAEEQERGMTIDIGFAFYRDRIAFVDVPGHEKFIRNMVAGAFGIDMVALIIAADDGVMPQTLEHLQILSQLKITQGFIVITKVDTVDEDWLSLIKEDIRNTVSGTFLDVAPVFTFSALDNQGLDRIQKYLDSLDTELFPRPEGELKYCIDRVFSRSGFGTVVTGTLGGRPLRTGDRVMIHPGRQETTVRGLQVHEQQVDTAFPGSRTAVNLSGLKKESVARGSVLSGINDMDSAKHWMINIEKGAEVGLKHDQRVRLLTGTTEVVGRIRLREKELSNSDLAWFAAEKDFFAFPEDRFILRSYSPLATLCGGRLLFPLPAEKKMSGKLLTYPADLYAGDYFLLGIGSIITGAELGRLGFDPSRFGSSVTRLDFPKSGHYFIHENHLKQDAAVISALIMDYHRIRPWSQGKPLREISLNRKIPKEIWNDYLQRIAGMSYLVINEQYVRHLAFTPKADDSVSRDASALLETMDRSGCILLTSSEMAENLGRPEKQVAMLLDYLIEFRKIRPLSQGMFISSQVMEDLRNILTEYFRKNSSLTVSIFRDSLDISRKYAVPILEFADKLGWTARSGDERGPGPELMSTSPPESHDMKADPTGE